MQQPTEVSEPIWQSKFLNINHFRTFVNFHNFHTHALLSAKKTPITSNYNRFIHEKLALPHSISPNCIIPHTTNNISQEPMRSHKKQQQKTLATIQFKGYTAYNKPTCSHAAPHPTAKPKKSSLPSLFLSPALSISSLCTTNFATHKSMTP